MDITEIVDTLMEAFQDRLDVKKVKALPGCGVEVTAFNGHRFEVVIVNTKKAKG